MDTFYGRRYGEDGKAPAVDLNLWDCKTVYVPASYYNRELGKWISIETVEEMPSSLDRMLSGRYTYQETLVRQAVPKTVWRG